MDNAFKVRTFKEVIADKNNFKEPGAVLGDFIKEGELSVIGVAANSSETAFCYDVAFANASGLCHWEEPVSDKIRKTLCVDFELSDSQIARRYANVPDFVSCSVRRAHPVSSAHGCSPEDTIRNIEKLVEENRPELVIIDDLGALYNPQIQISAESETKRSIFREKDKTKRSKKESAQHSKSRNKSFVMTSVSAL